MENVNANHLSMDIGERVKTSASAIDPQSGERLPVHLFGVVIGVACQRPSAVDDCTARLLVRFEIWLPTAQLQSCDSNRNERVAEESLIDQDDEDEAFEQQSLTGSDNALPLSYLGDEQRWFLNTWKVTNSFL